LIELTGSTTTPALLIFTDFAVLVTLRATVPKLSAVGETEKVDLTPVPESDTVLIAAPPPGDTLRIATFDPVPVGLNLMLIAQLAPTATEVPQLFVCVNWPGFVPPMTIDMIGKITTPVLCTVIVLAVEATFSARFPNATEVLDRV